MKKQITIIAGHDTNEEREQQTRTWLEQHGVKVEEWNGLQVLSMKAEMEKGIYTGQYVIGFDGPEGNNEESYLAINLEPDPYESRISIEYEGSYTCKCLGRGCTQCNDELAAIERGENPYAHHTK